MANRKPKVRLSDKKIKMYIKIVLSTLHQVTQKCETYDEFKKFIDYIFKEV